MIKKFLLATLGYLSTSKIAHSRLTSRVDFSIFKLYAEVIFLVSLGGLPKSILRSMLTTSFLRRLSSTLRLFCLVAFPTTEKGHRSLSQILVKVFN